MSKKKNRPETWWCIKSGSLLLPFTTRITRRQCVEDWVRDRPGADLGSGNKVVKIWACELKRREG